MEVHLFSIIVVDVACRSGRWGFSGSSGCRSRCGDSGHGRSSWGSGFVGGNLLVRLLYILFQDPDLILHGVNQSFHFGVCLLFQDLLYPSGDSDNFLQRPVTQFLHLHR